MTGRHYTPQEKVKVAAMVQYGLSKIKAAQILGIAPNTIWRWSIPATFKNKVYPPEIKQEVIKLHKSGVSRLKISIKLGIGLRTVNRWLGRDKYGREFKMYPIAIRLKARQLARSGVPKFEIANILHVCHATVIRWTSDIKENGDRVSGRYFQALCKLINNEAIVISSKNLRLFRVLKRQAKINIIVMGKKAVVFIKGKEKAAEKLLLSNSKNISLRKLNIIKNVLSGRKRTV